MFFFGFCNDWQLSSLQKVEIGISLLAHKFSKSAKNWTFQSISRHNLVHSVISKLLKPFVSANHSLAARAAVGEVLVGNQSDGLESINWLSNQNINYSIFSSRCRKILLMIKTILTPPCNRRHSMGCTHRENTQRSKGHPRSARRNNQLNFL